MDTPATPANLLLIALGGAACRIVQRLHAADGGAMRTLLLDTDDRSAVIMPPALTTHIFGIARLAGNGTGGDTVLGREAMQEEVSLLEPHLRGVRAAVILCCTGGGTSGALPDLLKQLRAGGISTLTFATRPFPFEGTARNEASRRVFPLIEEETDLLVELPLAGLFSGAEDVPVSDAFACAENRLAAGLTLFRKLVAAPGFIAFDGERFRSLLTRRNGARARLSVAEVTAEGGQARAKEAFEQLVDSPLLLLPGYTSALDAAPVLLLGVLAGDDLRLSEIGAVMQSLRSRASARAEIELGTVLDPALDGTLRLVLLAFESFDLPAAPAAAPTVADATEGIVPARARRPRGKATSRLGVVTDRFSNTEVTAFNGQNLDTPTYERRNILLDP